MKHRLLEWKERLRKWTVKHAEGAHAKFWLGAVSFSEASFFLIPPDVLLVAILLTNAKRWVYYAGLTTVFSVLGGLFGYGIGVLFFDTVGVWLVELYHLQDGVETVSKLFNDNAFLAIFSAAFTPIPFKVFTISAGLFKVNLLIFIVASLLGRGIRFFVVAYLLHRFGERVRDMLDRYFNLISLAVVLVLILLVIFLNL